MPCSALHGVNPNKKKIVRKQYIFFFEFKFIGNTKMLKLFHIFVNLILVATILATKCFAGFSV